MFSGALECGLGRAGIVSHYDLDIGAKVVFDDLAQRIRGCVLRLDETERSSALPNADNHVLVFQFSRVASLLSAEIRFVNFYDPAQRRQRTLAHGLTDAMIQVPRCLIAADTKITLHLFRGDA